MLAVSRNHPAAVEALLNHGANVASTYVTGATLLQVAVNGQRVEVAEVLLRHGAQATADMLGDAAKDGSAPLIEVLAPHMEDIDARDNLQRTALHWAALRGSTAAVKTLLDLGADINAGTDSGWTALHRAVRQGHQETAQLLIDRGADLAARNSSGQTPLDLLPDEMQLKISDP
jgi:ankyrin repeat protein